ncbi:MAG: hypothetical protein HUJ25_00060 [Crocinitomicaceae bacterium]|nr:hypothetical protein [Crocinitomicaceae bacterium]
MTLEREEILKLNQLFTEFLIQVQEAAYEVSDGIDSSPFDSQQSLKYFGGKTYKSDANSSEDYLIHIAESLEKLRIELSQDSLLIMGDYPTPWLSQKNDYPPVAKALNYLETIISESFSGGFKLKGKELIEFIPNLFWITRCNASLPTTYMCFVNSKTILSLCKYGILHLEFYDEAEAVLIKDFLNKYGFSETSTCNDPVNFDSFQGRELNML